MSHAGDLRDKMLETYVLILFEIICIYIAIVHYQIIIIKSYQSWVYYSIVSKLRILM